MAGFECADADKTDSYAADNTKLRAATSEIVNCVAKFCEELETDSKMVRRSKKGAKQQPPVKISSAKRHAVDTEAEEDGKALRTTEHRSNIQSTSKDSVDEVVETLGGDMELPEGGSLVEEENFISEKLGNDIERRDEVVEVSGLMSSLNSGRQKDRDDVCKYCADEIGTGAPWGDKDNGGEAFTEQHCRLATLELPDDALPGTTTGYSAINEMGDKWFRQVIEMLPIKGDWSPEAPDLWSWWETCSDTFEKRPSGESDHEIKTHEPLRLFSRPRRMQCDWCETLKSGEKFLYDESSRLLKAMVRANTQLMVLKKYIVVPNIFEADWGRYINDMYLPWDTAETGGELRQLLLPSDLVRSDDMKVIVAPSKVVSLADSYLRNLRRPDVSLTSASMNIPSVWNLSVGVTKLAELVKEELATMTPQSIAPASPSPVSPILQSDRTTREKADVSEPLSDVPVSSPRMTSLRSQLHSDDGDIAMQTDQPSSISTKLKVIADDNPLSTDYFLSEGFLQCNWSEPREEVNARDVVIREAGDTSDANGPLKYDQFLQQIARPALWDLMRKRLLQVDGTSFQHAFNRVSLETLEAIIYQQFGDVKKMSLNPSTFSSVAISEACASLRQAAWLHTLRIVSISRAAAPNGEMMSQIIAKLLPSSKYRRVLGPSNWKDLNALLKTFSGNVAPSDAVAKPINTGSEDPTVESPHKRQKVLQTEKGSVPVRVLCSIEFLEQDELLDELCTEHQIFFVERNLPPPIDMLVDERNCICIVTEAMIQVEASMRTFIFSLARLQVQFEKCWLVLALATPPSAETEDMVNSFFTALVQFRIDIQVLTSFSSAETGRVVRAVVDECAEVAMNEHRILPRLWFERPFLLEEESQFERFLVSTKIVNHYAAQSLLHKICMEDLFSKRIDELKLLVQNAVTDEQLELLWGLVQQDHGLDGGLP